MIWLRTVTPALEFGKGQLDQVDALTLPAAPESRASRVVVFVAAFAAAACAASFVEQDPPTPVFDHPPSFDARFAFDESSVATLERSALRPLARTFAMEIGSFQRAKALLARKLGSAGAEDSVAGGQRYVTAEIAIPLPRSRPLQANLDAEKERTHQASDVALAQKIIDLFSGGIKLASLGSDPILSDRSSARSLGVDDYTAVYDISARVVYMPGGSKLEAHSGLGALKDSPQHVSERDVGATPPAVYDLRPRERPFHGVQALRMIPIDGQKPLGRDGILTHGWAQMEIQTDACRSGSMTSS